MFNGEKIKDETQKKYYELVSIYKKKGIIYKEDIKKTIPIIEYFYNNYDNFNSDELKICKNAFIILNGIKTKINTRPSKMELNEIFQLEKTINKYIDDYNEKIKEPRMN